MAALMAAASSTTRGQMLPPGRASKPLLAPSAVVVLTTFSVSVLGDWLRDRLDPMLDR